MGEAEHGVGHAVGVRVDGFGRDGVTQDVILVNAVEGERAVAEVAEDRAPADGEKEVAVAVGVEIGTGRVVCVVEVGDGIERLIAVEDRRPDELVRRAVGRAVGEVDRGRAGAGDVPDAVVVEVAHGDEAGVVAQGHAGESSVAVVPLDFGGAVLVEFVAEHEIEEAVIVEVGDVGLRGSGVVVLREPGVLAGLWVLPVHEPSVGSPGDGEQEVEPAVVVEVCGGESDVVGGDAGVGQVVLDGGPEVSIGIAVEHEDFASARFGGDEVGEAVAVVVAGGDRDG